eukprot:m.393438 g.393438  ORF g.393438 m.393438 type:complete len:71 (-) comp16765_c0_seq47:609-821(-)
MSTDVPPSPPARKLKTMTAPNGVDYARRVFKRLKGAAFIKGKDEAYLCDNIAKAFESPVRLPGRARKDDE